MAAFWPARLGADGGAGFAGPYVDGWPQDASGDSFLSTAIVLAVALMLSDLIMITLRRQADRSAAASAARRAPDSPMNSGSVKSRQHPVRLMTADWGRKRPYRTEMRFWRLS
jgi:hypothetical protein